jgi:hypothetical protein
VLTFRGIVCGAGAGVAGTDSDDTAGVTGTTDDDEVHPEKKVVNNSSPQMIPVRIMAVRACRFGFMIGSH